MYANFYITLLLNIYNFFVLLKALTFCSIEVFSFTRHIFLHFMYNLSLTFVYKTFFVFEKKKEKL